MKYLQRQRRNQASWTYPGIFEVLVAAAYEPGIMDLCGHKVLYRQRRNQASGTCTGIFGVVFAAAAA